MTMRHADRTPETNFQEKRKIIGDYRYCGIMYCRDCIYPKGEEECVKHVK